MGEEWIIVEKEKVKRNLKRGVIVKGRKKEDGDINQQRLMTGMGTEGLVYNITVQFKIYTRFNATAWQ